MPTNEIELPVSDGALAGLDFGGDGPSVLLVHGTGHNASAWTDVASHLTSRCHPVAIDLRGHGQTRVWSTDAEQYWRDLGDVVIALGWERPVLVGHSTGGYAATAAAAEGLVTPKALCVVDGLVLDDRETAATLHANLRSAETLSQLRGMFRYGWLADEAQMDAYVEQCARQTDTDWLNAGARPNLVAQVTRRAFLRQGDTWLRRPTIEEVSTTTTVTPNARTCPSVEIYERIICPMAVVLPEQGFYAARRNEVRAIVDAAPERQLIDVAGHHNVPMTRPAEIAALILQLVES